MALAHQLLALLVERKLLARANKALLLGLVCGGLAVCAFGAVAIDLTRLFTQ